MGARLDDVSSGASGLVPGDADLLRATASGWRTDAGRAMQSVHALRELRTVEGWLGDSAESFTVFLDALATRWETQHDALLTAARVLDDWADTILWARGKASDAVTMYHHDGRHEAAQDLLDDALTQLSAAQTHAASRLNGLLQPAA